ncbi:MAG TPA: hypothetical protein VIZ58_10805 [Thermoanaerobaculia bacterium]
MNYPRIILAALGAFVAYFAIGFAVFAVAAGPMKREFEKYPAVYRPKEAMMGVMPIGMAAMLVGILVLAVLYAMVFKGGSGLAEGVRFGALIGVFVVCAFVVHNWTNLNIGARLTVYQALAYFVQWTVVGGAIGLIYRPR